MINREGFVYGMLSIFSLFACLYNKDYIWGLIGMFASFMFGFSFFIKREKVNNKFSKKIKLKRWTPEEILTLKEMWIDGKDIGDMSKKLKKSSQAIRGKLWQLQKKELYETGEEKYYYYGEKQKKLSEEEQVVKKLKERLEKEKNGNNHT